MIMEKLSTKCLEEIKDRIERILLSRTVVEEYDWDVPLEERREILKNRFLKKIKELEDILPRFKEEKLKWYDTVKPWLDSEADLLLSFEDLIKELQVNRYLNVWSVADANYLFTD